MVVDATGDRPGRGRSTVYARRSPWRVFLRGCTIVVGLLELAHLAQARTRVAPPWAPPSVQWNATPGRLPNYGPGEPGGFAIRAVDCLDWPPDGRTYCYCDLPLHSNAGCPGSYNSEIGCFSSANGQTNWTYHGIAIHKGQVGSADSGGVATPAALAANGRVYLYFSQEGGPPDYKPVTTLPNGPRGIGIGRADHPTGPFARLDPAAAAPAWPKNQSWMHGPHPGGILDDSQVLEYKGQYHLFHSRKLSTDTPGCPVSTGGNPCCVEWRVSSDAEHWVRRGVVLARKPPCEQHACEPMSARIYGDTLVLVTDGGACGEPDGSLASFTANASLLRGTAPFAFEPTDPPLLTDFLHFPSRLNLRDWAFRVLPKYGTPRFVGVATGSGNHDRNATFSIFPLGDSPAPVPPHASSSFTVVGAGSKSWNGVYTSIGGGIYHQQGAPSHSLYADGRVWRLAVKGAEMFYVATARHGAPAGPPLTGWEVAQHCNASAGRRPPSCQVGTGRVGGIPPAPHLLAHDTDTHD